ncbi:MAG: hypothetical protein H7249_19345 [Chitinophagaceae bacterium]|nr:hypothetical protein [Oligoflexus sp.]
MSKKFDTDSYVSRWDDRLIPIMLVVIVASLAGAYALNIFTRPSCTVHDYVFCGTPLDTYEGHGEHKREAGNGHDPEGGPHTPPGESGPEVGPH